MKKAKEIYGTLETQDQEPHKKHTEQQQQEEEEVKTKAKRGDAKQVNGPLGS